MGHDFLSPRSHHMVRPSIQVPWQAPAYGTQAVSSRDGNRNPKVTREEARMETAFWGLFPEPQLDLAQPTDFLRPESPPSAKYETDIWLLSRTWRFLTLGPSPLRQGGALQGRAEPFLALNISLITCLRAWPSDHLIHVLDKGFIFKNAAARIFLRL